MLSMQELSVVVVLFTSKKDPFTCSNVNLNHWITYSMILASQIIMVLSFQSVEKSGSYSDLAKPNSTCELKDLRRENETLKVRNIDSLF